jgi:hypothetical protein
MNENGWTGAQPRPKYSDIDWTSLAADPAIRIAAAQGRQVAERIDRCSRMNVQPLGPGSVQCFNRLHAMKKTLLALVLGTSTLTLLAAGVWQAAFSVPTFDPAPLPEHLVPLTASEGQRLVVEGADSVDYAPLASMFEAQRRPAFCGVASATTVLNALHGGQHMTQAAFFEDLPTELRVTFSGMTLDELGALLRKHGATAQVVHADETTLEEFRIRARDNLSRSGDYVLVNYQRATLGQREGGHISPLAAYSASTDQFLVLDVAAYRYPPVWVRTADLWNAMNTLDSASGRTRGLVLVELHGIPRQ